jgi:hypothetical protein
MGRVIGIWVLALCVVGVSCSKRSEQLEVPAASGQGGLEGVDDIPVGGQGGVPNGLCSELDYRGVRIITPQSVDAPSPEPRGGEVVDGTYDLVAITYYDGEAVKEDWLHGMRLRFEGNRFEELYLPQDEQESLSSGTFGLDGKAITFDFECPAASASVSFPYTATPSTFIEYTPRGEYAYERR